MKQVAIAKSLTFGYIHFTPHNTTVISVLTYPPISFLLFQTVLSMWELLLLQFFPSVAWVFRGARTLSIIHSGSVLLGDRQGSDMISIAPCAAGARGGWSQAWHESCMPSHICRPLPWAMLLHLHSCGRWSNPLSQCPSWPQEANPGE